MFNLVSLVSLLAFSAVPAWSAITPTSPDSNTVVKVGNDIEAMWAADTTGSWNNVEIQLMTGDNLHMIPLATLATGIDGTKTTSLNMPCPAVSPYSKIYFLQFTLGGDVSTSTWTTRFTITGADGTTTPPSNTTNYSGTEVQWGVGVLTGQAPTPITGSSSGSSSSTSNSTSNSTSQAVMSSAAPMAATSASSSAMPESEAESTATQAVVAAATTTSASMSQASASASGMMSDASRASAAPSVSASGAALRKSTVGLGAVVLGLAGMVAL